MTGMSGSHVPIRSSLTAHGGELRGTRGKDSAEGMALRQTLLGLLLTLLKPIDYSQRCSRHDTGGKGYTEVRLLIMNMTFTQKTYKQQPEVPEVQKATVPESNVSRPHLKFHTILCAIKPLLFISLFIPLVPSYPVTLHLPCGITQF